MKSTRIIPALVGTLLVGAAAAFAPAASANNVAWSVSVGVPGLAITAGEPAYYGAPYRPYYRPYYRPVVVAPPVVYAPYYAPVAAPVYRPYRYYAPRPVVYGPPVVVHHRH
ncbi:MAG: hypothetical protein U1F48_08845 [Burkholderiales bacterium]